MQVIDGDILAISRLVYELCGLTLDASKGYLIESRLGDIAKTAGCANFAELAQKARSADGRAIQTAIIDAITTQETLFFRDQSPFDTLQYKVLPDLIDARAGTPFARRLRILSAACSTGQEPYSIAITLCETLPDAALWNINIQGVDISNAAIRQASYGHFADIEMQRGMKPHLMTKYFQREPGGWKAKDELRAMMTFSRRSLLQPIADMGPFDVIFCRNVAIYFDAPTRRELFFRLADRLTPDGCLFVGSSECLVDLGPRFAPRHHCRGTYYQPCSADSNVLSFPTTGPLSQAIASLASCR
ncbi:MAG: protein-glutamate O-methyltransferase CheR [Planctomycetaceae bacterium]|nr:protein-glutamate O-methyltransferase CheR [Planctomycetaceae bacterium]